MPHDYPEDLLTVEEHDKVLVLRICRSQLLDDTPRTLKQAVAELADDPRFGTIVVNLEDVTMVSSEAVGVLVGLVSRLRKREAELILVGLRPRVAEIFRLCRLIASEPGANAPMAEYPDVATALAASRRA